MTAAVQTEQKIPASAARFAAVGMFQFVAGEGDGAESVPVRLHARDSQPIWHWYWGKIAHDMSGVIHREKLAIDWCHDPDQILGYVDQVKADAAKGLDLAGAILVALDEKAAEIAKKAAAGVPYESSIGWNGPAVIEWVDSGMSSEVNGYKFEGPGYIVREWYLRGVAICPHGADFNTTTEFAAGQDVGVRVFTQGKEVIMPTIQSTQNAGTPAATSQAAQTATTQDTAPVDGVKTQAAEPVAAANDRASAGQRFMQAFGEDLGAKLFAQGLSFEDATAEHSKQLTAANKTLQDEVTQLKAQVGILRGQMGQSDPATFTPEGAKPAQEQTLAGTDNARRFAAAITLPKLPKTK